MAYKGWIAETYGLWENRCRNELKDAVNEAGIRPEMEAFGDLRRIRNDLLHSGTASAEWCGQCSTLKWFQPGERMVFGIGNVLDFLNQTGVLSQPHALVYNDTASCTLSFSRDRDELLAWSPTPRLVSVRTHNDGKEHEPPYKGITVVRSDHLYQPAVAAREPRRPGDGRRRLPVTGPSIRIAR